MYSEENLKDAVLEKLGSKYSYVGNVGSGAFSHVYRLRHTLLGEDHALKIMNSECILQKLETEDIKESHHNYEEIKKRFLEEARLYKKINHPGIVKIYDVDVIKAPDTNIDIPYMIMKFINGENLKNFLKTKATLGLSKALDIATGILDNLEALHQKNIIHRDIKPANIMIEAESGIPVLIDFGLAKDIEGNSTLTKIGLPMGTPRYMSPEQWKGEKDLTPATDIYSFGVVLYEMLTGEVPFNGKNPQEIMYGHLGKPVPNIRQKNPDLPVGIEDIIFKAMAKEPEKRYNTTVEFLNDLKKIGETLKRVEKEKKADNVKWLESIKSELKAMNKESIRRFERAEDSQAATLSKVDIKKDQKNKKTINPNYPLIIGIISVIVTIISIAVTVITLINYYSDKGRNEQHGEVILVQQSEDMNRDFDGLKVFLKGKSSNKEKLQRCREFLAKHEGVPANSEKTAIFSEIDNSISNLTAAIKRDEDYQNLLSTAGEYIKKGDYPEAVDTLERAKNNRGRITDEIAALSNQIREKQIEVMNGEQYQRYMDTVKNLIKSEDYEGAKRELAKAGKINKSDEVKRLSTAIAQGLENERINGKKEYKTIRDKITLSQYQAFWRVYPNSIHLPDLKERLKATDKNLPPEKYWDKPISKNDKGYYEFTFGSELNAHQMIYIPEKKIWIDKYEVAWAQFRKFLQAAKLKFPPIPDDKIINSGDTFPAVITYEYAQKYCQQYGLRIPSANEWEYAAGKGTSLYPWGNESPDENGIWRANFDSLEGTVEKDGFEGTAPVKSFEKYSSPFGAVNMAGNVWEWIQGNILKGGGFFSSKEDLKITNFKRGNNDKEGFRCVKLEK